MPKPKRQRTRQDADFEAARAQIRSKGNPLLGLARYKKRADASELERTLPLFLQHAAYKALFWSHPVPRRMEDIGAKGLRGAGTFEQELTWLVQTLLPHVGVIKDFLIEQVSFSDLLLRGTAEAVWKQLDVVEEKCGLSIWLLQARINLLRLQSAEAERAYSNAISQNKNVSPFIRVLVPWLSVRCEPGISSNDFLRLLDATHDASSAIDVAVRIAVGDCPVTDKVNWSHVLSYADYFQLIDRYFFICRVLQVMVANQAHDNFSVALRAITPLVSRIIGDPALQRLYFILGGQARAQESELDPIFDLLVSGQDASAVDRGIQTFGKSSLHAVAAAVEATILVGRKVEETLPLQDDLLSTIARHLTNLASYSADASDSTQRLAKIAMDYSFVPWSSDISLILSQRENNDVIFPASAIQVFKALCTHNDHVGLHFCLERPGLFPDYLSFLPTSWQNSLTFKLAKYLSDFSLGDSPSADATALASADWAIAIRALIALRKGKPDYAADLLLETSSSDISDRIPAIKHALLLAESLLRAGRLQNTAAICATLTLISPYLVKLLPIARLTEKLVEQADKADRVDPKWFGHIAVVILFDLYSRFVSASHDPERSDAFKDFLRLQGVKRASELATQASRFNREELVYFFGNVCVPEVLDQSLVLDSTRAVEDERARILVLASELLTQGGKVPPPEFAEELRTIRTRQIVRETRLRVDQSRIYVNIEGIKRVVGPSLRETWHQYVALGIQETMAVELGELKSALESALGERLAIVDLNAPLTTREKLFARMVINLRDIFAVSREFGLDANLSTNIRHGFVMRELRGPLVANHLVTNRESEAGDYQPNAYWKERLSTVGDWRIIDEALAKFSERIDGEIEHLNRRLLRIRTESNPEGVFDFDLGILQIQILQRQTAGVTAYDEFFEIVMQYLWQITNTGLERVRTTLRSSVSQNIYLALSDLHDTLATSGHDMSDVLNALNRVRPEIASAVERVASWFTLSGNVEYPDYLLPIAFEAALATVRTYYADLNIVPSFKAETMMSGATLPSFVRIFSLLMENAATHSGVVDGRLDITAEANVDDGLLIIHVKNSLAEGKDLDEVRQRAAQINREFGGEVSSRLIREEGGSGYAKIWKILAHDIGGEHVLQVSLLPSNEFSVEIMIDTKGVVIEQGAVLSGTNVAAA